MKIALIKAAWHSEIVGNAVLSFHENISDQYEIEEFEVPGSLEIPLLAQKLANTKNYKAICCVGFVTDGGIYRHDFVAHAILQSFMKVQLKTEIPVMSAVLTPQESFAEDGSNPKQYNFFKDHMLIKGKELAQSTMQTIDIHNTLN